MFKHLLLLLIVFSGFTLARAQGDSSQLRISLLTCGPADNEIWEVFGHTAVRVVDSAKKTDLVFNYGMFDYGPGFELQFMRGKLLYSLGVEQWDGFLPQYLIAKRSVEEQVLLLNGRQKEAIYAYLLWNAEDENRRYKYDFFFDNCATRIRDILPKPQILGKAFHFGQAIDPTKPLSFRDIINQYFYRDHWTRIGVNILLGSKIDKPMSNADIMFLPDYLKIGIGNGTLNGRKIASDPIPILTGGKAPEGTTNWPLVLTLFVAFLTIIGLSVKRLQLLGRVMSISLLVTTGLLGCIILVMWFATDHQGCSNNYNLLWCLPTNLVIAFFNPKGKGRYAVIAFVLLFVSLLLHLLKVQGLTILELTPLFLALLFVYGTIFRKSQLHTKNKNA
jgi:Domain of unknown function (DUF4105)